MTIMRETMINDFKSIRQKISDTFSLLEDGQISIQQAAIVIKGCDVINRTFSNEHEKIRLGLIAAYKE